MNTPHGQFLYGYGNVLDIVLDWMNGSVFNSSPSSIFFLKAEYLNSGDCPSIFAVSAYPFRAILTVFKKRIWMRFSWRVCFCGLCDTKHFLKSMKTNAAWSQNLLALFVFRKCVDGGEEDKVCQHWSRYRPERFTMLFWFPSPGRYVCVCVLTISTHAHTHRQTERKRERKKKF